jgi:hypothetical protein
MIVIVTATSQKFCQLNIADTTTCTPVKQLTMAVNNGDDEYLTLKVDPSLGLRKNRLRDRGAFLCCTIGKSTSIGV